MEQPLIIGGGDGLVHYSELHESDLPINVRQYVGELVIRVHYRGNEEFRKFLLLNKHSSEADEEGKIDYKVWAKSETGGYIDLQISEDGFFKLVEKFSTPEYQLDYEVMVEDLAQTVFESYPRGQRWLSIQVMR